jgi:uncharacterized protein HemY
MPNDLHILLTILICLAVVVLLISPILRGGTCGPRAALRHRPGARARRVRRSLREKRLKIHQNPAENP